MTDPKPTRRWYHLTPDRLIIALLVGQVLLLLSDRFQWFPFKKLQALRTAGPQEPQRSDLGLWLVARYALADERTRALGQQLAKRAISAAEKQPDPRWKQAMLREQKAIMKGPP